MKKLKSILILFILAFNVNANANTIEAKNLKAAERANKMSKMVINCYYSVPKNQTVDVYQVKAQYDTGMENMRYALGIMKSRPNFRIWDTFEIAILSFKNAIATGKRAGGTSC